MYSSDLVCLAVYAFVSVCAAEYLKKLSIKRIWTKFCGEVERGPGKNRLGFVGDPDSFVDPGSRSLPLADRA